MRKLFLFVNAVVLSHTALASGVVETRQELFKSFKEEMGAIKEIVNAGAVDKQAQLNKHAQTLAKASEEQWLHIDAYFAKGEHNGDTDALPSIWEDFSAFRSAADKQKLAINNFVAASQKNDAAEWKKAFGQLGGSCKGCHEKFRKD